MSYAEVRRKFLHAKRRDSYAQRLFRAALPHEERLGKDLSQFSGSELRAFLGQTFSVRDFPISRVADILRLYTKQCRDAGLPVSGGWTELKPSQEDKCRAELYAGPLHLAAELDRVFSPVEENGADLLCRCFLWLAFAEAPSDAIMTLRREDTDLLRRRVEIGGTHYRIYEEAAELFARVKDMDAFRVVEPKGDRYIDRRHPEMFFSFMERGEKRGVVGDYDPTGRLVSMKIRLSAVSMETGASLSYSAARTSGMFYRTYDLERSMRIASPEEALVNFDSRGVSGERKDRRTTKALLARYQAWKQAFAV